MKHILILPLAMITAACGSTSTAPAGGQPAPAVHEQAARPAMARLRALVYQTDKPCRDNVAISLTADGKGVLSYPAPSDVSAASAPLQLPDGWLLDRRGIGPNTAFLNITYAEYARLKQAPSNEELMKMVLRDVHVTEMLRLDMTPQAAAADTAAAMAEIRSALNQ